jgi:hypothetical protein
MNVALLIPNYSCSYGKKKTPDVPESSLVLQSLRWHYPDQVVGVFLRFSFLVIARNVGTILVYLNHPLEEHLRYS